MNCNVDQQSFKAYLARWMAGTAKVAPFTHDAIMKRLRGSAVAAAKQCSGGETGHTCGTRWYEGAWDGTYGVGQQMNALEVFQSNLADQVSGPLSNSTGGTSRGNPSAGTGPDISSGGGGGGTGRFGTEPITTGDKAGAGILTALVVVFVLGGAWYVAPLSLSLKIGENANFYPGGWLLRYFAVGSDQGYYCLGVWGAFNMYCITHNLCRSQFCQENCLLEIPLYCDL